MQCCLERRERTLAILMVVGACLSTSLLVIAISSDHLVYCYEKYGGPTEGVPNLLPNITSIYVMTNFGYWRACSQFTDADGTSVTFSVNVTCHAIPWQVSKKAVAVENSEGETTLTSAVLGHVMIKVVFALTLMGLLVQVAGHVTCLIHHRRQRPNSCMFITGVWYVTSGLGLLAAIIVLTGLLTEESMRQKELPDHEVKLFRYHYASSFVVLTLSFCLVEIAAILAVYLFIVRYKVAYKANHSQLHELKSRTQLVGELLNRRRMNSTSTTEGSRRPSYLPCPTNFALRAETNHSYTPAELEEEYIRAGNDLHPSIDGRCNGVRCSEGSCELVSIPPPPMFSNTPVITVHRQCTTTV